MSEHPVRGPLVHGQTGGEAHVDGDAVNSQGWHTRAPVALAVRLAAL